jgi:hypothetical protein
MRRLPPLLIAASLLAGCCYRLLPGDRICEDLAYAVSERTRVCEEDAALANERHAAFSDAAECLLSDEVEAPYNPDGILPASDDPEGAARLERRYGCVRTVPYAVAVEARQSHAGTHSAVAELEKEVLPRLAAKGEGGLFRISSNSLFRVTRLPSIACGELASLTSTWAPTT